jgi:hypothetical protein
MSDVFSTDVLTGVLQSLLGNPQFLLDRYFGTVQSETTEQIHFDVIQGKRRVAPFVSPLVEGQIVASQGFITNTFSPAYIKDKRVFDMNRPLKRSAGEQIGGTLAPSERLRALIAYDMEDQLAMLRRRLEVMCGEVLVTGKSTISGDKYPTQVVDFQRSSSHTVNPASPLWSTAGVKILDNLQDWGTIVLQDTGVFPRDVLMTPDVWKVFRSDPTVLQVLNVFRSYNTTPTLTANALQEEGGILMGEIQGFNIFVYSGWYVDPATGTETQILPAGTLLMTSPALQGVQAYGAIRDDDSLVATPYFVKSWVQQDPSVRFVMLQSAPIMVPYRPNASFMAKVL